MLVVQAVRQQQASQISTLEVQLEAAQLCVARAEAAHEHAVQQQFADDCLKVRLHHKCKAPLPGHRFSTDAEDCSSSFSAECCKQAQQATLVLPCVALLCE